ncbi:MAG TPA: hypothetical protein VNM72_06375 [Blastocatellia bacterium]|nr:hypothetical protein [Blastocatellia bacterium]
MGARASGPRSLKKKQAGDLRTPGTSLASLMNRMLATNEENPGAPVWG